MPHRFEGGPAARTGANDSEYIQTALGHGLRIWWAFFWRKSVLFAILLAALLWTVDPLFESGAIPFWFYRYLTEFGPYVINYAGALLVFHFILRKRFRNFRIGLVAFHEAATDEELPPTFPRTLRIWWTYSWRTFAYCVGIYFVVSVPMGQIVGTLGSLYPRLNDAFAYSAGLVIEGAAGLFVIYSNILGEDFSDFRVCLMPRKTVPRVTTPEAAMPPATMSRPRRESRAR
jgi:hypothetical protein